MSNAIVTQEIQNFSNAASEAYFVLIATVKVSINNIEKEMNQKFIINGDQVIKSGNIISGKLANSYIEYGQTQNIRVYSIDKISINHHNKTTIDLTVEILPQI